MLSIENFKVIWLIISLSLLPITIAYLAFFKKLISLLRLEHSDKYRELGEIGFIKNNTISNSGRFTLFLVLGKYKSLKNPELIKIGDVCRALLILGYLIFVLAFIMPVVKGLVS